MDTLSRIKQTVAAGRIDLTTKARLEMDDDLLNERDIIESILNAQRIEKSIRSISLRRDAYREMLHVICSPNCCGQVIYTKGKLKRVLEIDVFCVLVSAKLST